MASNEQAAEWSPSQNEKSMVSGCAVCNKKSHLSNCSACKCVHYCSREHQILHRPTHKGICNKIKKSKAKLDAEENTLQNHPGGFMLPANPFESAAGHFWGLPDTRDYMTARYAYVEAILKAGTRIAVKAAVEALEDMFRLCRSDNMGLRYHLPALYLRLGQDQKCYDFCKWWCERYFDSNYDSGDLSAPYLDIKDADVFEPVDLFISGRPSPLTLVPVMLLKIRLSIDLQSLQRARTDVGPLVPQEILDNIQRHVVSDVISKNKPLLEREEHGPQIQELKRQIRQIFDAVREANEFFGKLLDSEECLGIRPHSYSAGSLEEMIIAMNFNHDSWVETPGARDVLFGLFADLVNEFAEQDAIAAREGFPGGIIA